MGIGLKRGHLAFICDVCGQPIEVADTTALVGWIIRDGDGDRLEKPTLRFYVYHAGECCREFDHRMKMAGVKRSEIYDLSLKDWIGYLINTVGLKATKDGPENRYKF